jgi:hypothetical protein
MNYGFCNLALVPLRREANNVSEQVSQLLFGETFEVLKTIDGRCLIKTCHDSYQGWVSQKQFLSITCDDLEKLNAKPKFYCTKLLTTIEQMNLTNGRSDFLPITFGSVVCDYRYTIGNYAFTIDSNDVMEANFNNMACLIDLAKRFLGSPYQWGGRSILGIDCSGFTQLCYRFVGIELQRDAWQQAGEGSSVQSLEKAQQGDLCFFSQPDSETITHTGIYLGQNKIIHACGKVRIDTLTDEGIFDIETNSRSHKLLKIRTWNDVSEQ